LVIGQLSPYFLKEFTRGKAENWLLVTRGKAENWSATMPAGSLATLVIMQLVSGLKYHTSVQSDIALKNVVYLRISFI